MRQRTIRGRIFYNYGLLLVLLLFVFLVFINVYMRTVLNNKSLDTIAQFSFSISEQIDAESRALYNFIANTSSSKALRLFFFESNDDEITQKTNERNITDLILSIAGPMYRFHRLILRRYDGLIYEYSPREIEFSMHNIVNEQKQAIIETKKLKGSPYFRGTFLDKTSALYKEFPVISVNLAFSEFFGNQYTNTIEAQQSYKTYANIIESSIEKAKESGYQYYVYIFDENGETIYPYIPVNDNTYYWLQTQKQVDSYTDKLTGEKYIGKFYKSNITGWTTLNLCKSRDVMRPTVSFTIVSTVFILLLLVILLIISYSISNSITIPLQKIKKSIDDYDLTNNTRVNPLKKQHDFDELTSLSNTFYNMQERINNYLEELVAVKTHDLQSQFSALQSQMNPHFIYNSISLISIMCEEKGNDDVVAFCSGLTDMLRYGSTNYLGSVSLAEEADYALTYLTLLQKRYEGLLDIDVTIPDDLKENKIPKLILQPIVENCIKYGLGSAPPWFISLEAVDEDDGWSIIISDTGDGFSDESLKEINCSIKEINLESCIPELRPNGMGILNIYIRLKMFFKQSLDFEVGNQPEGGSCVSIRVREGELSDK